MAAMATVAHWPPAALTPYSTGNIHLTEQPTAEDIAILGIGRHAGVRIESVPRGSVGRFVQAAFTASWMPQSPRTTPVAAFRPYQSDALMKRHERVARKIGRKGFRCSQCMFIFPVIGEYWFDDSVDQIARQIACALRN
jgi:hypothetical protein